MIENYYLNLKKVSKLKDSEERERIHRYYQDMMHSFSDNRKPMATSIFNTLYKAGYLKNLRDERIDEVLN
jgi:hypothetical protein